MVTNDSFRAQANALLNSVFDERPVLGLRDYVQSSVFDLRRALVRGERLEHVPVDHPHLPVWLQDAVGGLGPYEQRVLADLMLAANEVTVMRGGTGSGKTSLVRCLRTYARKLCDEKNWKQQFGTVTFFREIDLQGVSESIRDRFVRDNPSVHRELLSYLITTVAGLLETGFRKVVDGDMVQVNRIFFEALACDTGDTCAEVERVVDILRDRCRKLGWTPGDELTGTTRIRELAMASFENPKLKLIASLLPFIQLGRMHSHEGYKFILVVDNGDPLPAALQLYLYRTLAGLVSSDRLRNSGLNVVLLLRLSSSFDPCGALPNYELQPHCCPDPAELVFFRLTKFLLDPTSNPAFMTMDIEHQGVALARLINLWGRLTDHEVTFSDIFGAIAGTNLRNALANARAWCLSPALSVAPLAADALLSFEATLRVVIGRHVLREVGSAVGRGVRLRLLQGGILELAEELEPEEVGRRFAIPIAGVVVGVLRDLGVVDADDRQIDGPRMVVARVAVEAIRSTIGRRSGDMFREAQGKLADELSRALPLDLRRKVGAALVDNLVPAIAAEFTVRSKHLVPAAQTLARLIGDWTIATAWAVFTGPQGDDTRIVRAPNRPETAGYRTLLLQLPVAREPSRYEAARILFDRSGSSKLHEAGALNVFAVGDDRPCPVVLRVLYQLAQDTERPLGQVFNVPRLPTKAMLEDLYKHGYSQTDVRDAWNHMVELDRRLIYSSVSDHFDGFDEFLRARAGSVALSWAGQCYYDILCATPVYLQWALWQIGAVRRHARDKYHVVDRDLRYLTPRLKAALAGFEIVIDHEHKQLAAMLGKLSDDDAAVARELEMDCHNASLDVFFRSLHSFLATLERHSGEMKYENELRDVQHLANMWLQLGRAWYERDKKLFKTGVERWERELEFAGKVGLAIAARGAS